MHVCFDWDGTLAKIDVAKEAAIRRSVSLGERFDDVWLEEAMKTDAHYAVNKRLISEYTGVVDEDFLNVIMTDFFRYHYLGVCNELKEDVLFFGVKDLILKLKEMGFVLSIATTLRKDIVVGVLKNLGLTGYFSYVAGNDSKLSYSKNELVFEVSNVVGSVDFMVGDKSDDVLAGQMVNSKGVLVAWGSHKDFEGSDFVVKNVEELFNLLTKAL